jgi:hypothetical protein
MAARGSAHHAEPRPYPTLQSRFTFPFLAARRTCRGHPRRERQRRRERAVCGHRPRQLRVVATATEAAPRILWPQLTRGDLEHLTGQAAKFEANLAAITLLRSIEAEGRPARADDRQVLQRYTGWGGLPASFNLEAPDSTWAERARRLQELLPAEDYESARASVNNSHYTEVHVIDAIWQAVERFGFTGGRILEPAAGIGHFIGAMPRNLAERSTAPPLSRSTGFPAASSRRSTRPAAWTCGFPLSRKPRCPTTGSTW